MSGQTSLEAVLGESLNARDWRDTSHGLRTATATIAGETRRLLVAVDRRAPVRWRELRGDLAVAVLRLKRVEADDDPVRIVAIAVPRTSSATATRAGDFMEEFAPDIGWVLFDDIGGVRAEIPGTGTGMDRDGSARVRPRDARPGQTRDVFTDLNRHLLKVMLLQEAAPTHWQGRRTAIENPTQLATLAQVALETSHKFARTFRDEGFLTKQSRRLRLIRKPELIRRWFQAERLVRNRRFPTRWSWAGDHGIDLTEIMTWSGPDPWGVIGGFEACRLLQVLHTRSPGLDVHVHGNQPIETLLETLGLEPCEQRDANVTLVVPTHPRSVMKNTVYVEDSGLWVVDVMQAALDCVKNRARGSEQAEYIVQEVLGIDTDE